MAEYSFPVLKTKDIAAILSQFEIAGISHDQLERPSPEFVCSLFDAFLKYLDPERDDPGSASFAALEVLENPEHHTQSVLVVNLYCKLKDVLSRIGVDGFLFNDLVIPESNKTVYFVSGLINFCLYREDKIGLIDPVINNDYAASLEKLEMKLAEKKNELLEIEGARKAEEPMVNQLEPEVKELKRTVLNLNEQQASLKATHRNLREKLKEIDEKISSAEFQLAKHAQENSELRSKIVQSPEKLQKTLEEKKSVRVEMKSCENSAIQTFQRWRATMNLYKQACKKLSKSLDLMRSIQEQVESIKHVEKQRKTLQVKLKDAELEDLVLEAKSVELQGKVEQADKLTLAVEQEKALKCAEADRMLSAIKSEMGAKLHELELMEKNLQATMVEANNDMLNISEVRKSGEALLEKLGRKFEELVNEFNCYWRPIDVILEQLNGDPVVYGVSI
ncbi:kinetochore protein Nuf2 [Amborella trichopoda]|uniref:kinetochore protein Nuf2 n=1 Tax=Amborella trichopoda TaxID=13333 RepID=UPI0009C14EEF|nr:kinetochore protein Nuf2 [Amborella trichopoda]|eukprot:XP_020523810.1 kinetochore protein Nuf2 [Amborella trichopoda]